jgi:hypothetical protein
LSGSGSEEEKKRKEKGKSKYQESLTPMQASEFRVFVDSDPRRYDSSRRLHGIKEGADRGIGRPFS